MAALKAEHKTFIVAAIARYLSPTEVAEAVKAEFNIEIERQQVRYYNPEQNETCPKQWRELFERERKTYLESYDRIGIANGAYRQERYQDLLRGILSAPRPNVHLALEVLKQAAQDAGGVFEAKKELTAQAPTVPLSIEQAILKVYGSNDAEAGDAGATHPNDSGST